LSNTQTSEEQEAALINGFWAPPFPVALSTEFRLPEAVKPNSERLMEINFLLI
jgi:hypothetical protein